MRGLRGEKKIAERTSRVKPRKSIYFYNFEKKKKKKVAGGKRTGHEGGETKPARGERHGGEK